MLLYWIYRTCLEQLSWCLGRRIEKTATPTADNQNGAVYEAVAEKANERDVTLSKPARRENGRRKRPYRLGLDNGRKTHCPKFAPSSYSDKM